MMSVNPIISGLNPLASLDSLPPVLLPGLLHNDSQFLICLCSVMLVGISMWLYVIVQHCAVSVFGVILFTFFCLSAIHMFFVYARAGFQLGC